MSARRWAARLRHALRHRCCHLVAVTSVGFFVVLTFVYWQQVSELNEIEARRLALRKSELADVGAKDAAPVDLAVVFRQGEPGNFEPRLPEKPGNGPGEGGKAVPSNENAEEVRRANAEFGFNTFASDQISLNRTIPDTRPDECRWWHYPEALPSASVVVVFHNEGWSPLLRTVHSVINRSPPTLLHEVLLVDDFSDKEHLKSKLETYIEQFQGKVRLIRNEEREGLIRSRSRGAENARGDVVIFLDAHCEVNTNWLAPLLAPIAVDRRVMTVPIIDGIEWRDWAYRKQYGGRNVYFRGIFEWGLLYKETEIPRKEADRRQQATEPFRSPTHAGGLFAIERRWFGELGYYDPGLQIWGGEQYELSFKIWQCGGGILFVPCSHVGHVYRNRMPYGFGKLKGPVVATNLKRVVEVWMDEYKKYYYIREPSMSKHDAGDLSGQLALRERLQCKPFSWYMREVAYDVEAQYPLQPDNVAWGEARNPASNLCLDTRGEPVHGTVGTSHCHGFGGNQMFRVNAKGQLTSGEWCITPTSDRLQSGYCPKSSVSGPWHYSHETQLLSRPDKNQCLTINADSQLLSLAACDQSNQFQKFVWKEIWL